MVHIARLEEKIFIRDKAADTIESYFQLPVMASTLMESQPIGKRTFPNSLKCMIMH